MNGRIYDPVLGRFLSADSKIDGKYSLQGYNRYSYVQNNPLRFTDPSGFGAEEALPLLYVGGAELVKFTLIAFGATAAADQVATHIDNVLANLEAAGSGGSGSWEGAPGITTQQFLYGQQQQMMMQKDQAQASSKQVETKKQPAEKPAEQAKPKENSSGGQMDPNSNGGDDKKKVQLDQNSKDGKRREQQVQEELKQENPGKSVQREQYLRDKDGNIVRDPKTGEARRVDHAVIDRETNTAKTVETTGPNVDKTGQTEKEARVRTEANGGAHVRDRETGDVVPVPDASELRRRQ